MTSNIELEAIWTEPPFIYKKSFPRNKYASKAMDMMAKELCKKVNKKAGLSLENKKDFRLLVPDPPEKSA